MSARDSAVLVGVQVSAALAFTLPAMLLIGMCAGWVPAVGTLLGSFLVSVWWGRRRPGFLSRQRIRRLAVHSGLAHAPLVGIAYAASYAAWPDAFEFQATALLLLAPALGFAGGIVAAVLTLCGADGAAAALGESLQA